MTREQFSSREVRPTAAPREDESFSQYRVPEHPGVEAAPPPAAAHENPWMSAIKGAADLQITDPSKSDSRTAGASPGQQMLEAAMKDSGYARQADGTTSIKGPDGIQYSVKPRDGFDDPQVIDSNGNPVSDSRLAEALSQRLNDLSAKQELSDAMSKTPLDEQQKKAVDDINSALKSKDLAAVDRLVKQFGADPKQFDAVFTHVLGEQALTGGAMLAWGYSPQNNTGYFSVNYEGGRPVLTTKLSKGGPS